ncbi:hypothetical protein KUCAC02_028454 [Chaenocephalus aceratus]|uniref:Uncharacterized protein n=1 Tax=Chaenocephalus aceratus TaxID=36190 RepID=A0ACB9X2P4_CHAAC|nr:hypothetical protein KUCAC02_028454 [Chaenocephalus aceratus]
MAEEGSKDEERALLVAQINSLDEQQRRYLECDVVNKHNEDMTSLCDALREKTQVSNVLMKMQIKQKKAVTTELKQNKALRKLAPMNFPSKDGSDPTREQLQKERSRIGKLETIMQDGDIFVNQIMTKEPPKAKHEDHIQSHLAGAEPEAD